MKQPTPQDIARMRNDVRITQTEAAAIVQASLRTWQNWESGATKMRPALWELFKQKVKQQTR